MVSAGYTLKSCGATHAYCGACRPEVAANVVAARRTPEARAATSIRSRLYFAKPNARQMMSSALRRYYAFGPGGWRVPGAQRDAFVRRHLAYVASGGVCRATGGCFCGAVQG